MDFGMGLDMTGLMSDDAFNQYDSVYPLPDNNGSLQQEQQQQSQQHMMQMMQGFAHPSAQYLNYQQHHQLHGHFGDNHEQYHFPQGDPSK